MSDIETLMERLTHCQWRRFAIASARRVQHSMRDPRSIAALDVAERHLRAEATNEELAEARDAALAAARDGSEAAQAACYAVRYAARYAARAALSASLALFRDAERAWQREELERMLKEGGGACGG